MVKSPPPLKTPGPYGGMAERLKAHVLKTCLGHTNVGSNPTPSARRLTIGDFRLAIENRQSKTLAPGASAGVVNLHGEVPEWSNGAAC
jgi:hypothetical protein